MPDVKPSWWVTTVGYLWPWKERVGTYERGMAGEMAQREALTTQA